MGDVTTDSTTCSRCERSLPRSHQLADEEGALELEEGWSTTPAGALLCPDHALAHQDDSGALQRSEANTTPETFAAMDKAAEERERERLERLADAGLPDPETLDPRRN